MKKKIKKTECAVKESKPEKESPGRPGDDARAAAETDSVDEPEAAESQPKVDSSVAICQAKERMARERKTGPDRPIGGLTAAEAALKNRTRALQILSAPKTKNPDNDLLIHQLNRAVHTGSVCNTIATKIRRDTLSLYVSLDSRDPIESILNRHIVAMSNGAMDCQHRSTYGGSSTFEAFARHAEKMTEMVIKLVDALERRRQPKQVVVGNVKVEAGGQAIVGTIEAHEQRSRSDDDASNDSSGP